MSPSVHRPPVRGFRSLAAGLLAALLASSCLLPAPSALAVERVTVVLKSGQKYENVSYAVQRNFNTLELTGGEHIVRVSFSDIEAILDAQGTNIAPRVLGTRYRPRVAPGAVPESAPLPAQAPADSGAAAGSLPAESVVPADSSETMPGTEPPAWRPDSSESAQGVTPPAQPSAWGDWKPEKEWRVALTLHGGFDVPFGDYYDGTKGGPGFGGTLHVLLTHELALRAEVTRLGIDFKDSYGVVSADPNFEIVSQEHHIDATRIQGGLEYTQPLRRAGRWNGLWFGHASLGAIRHQITGRIRVREISSGQVIPLAAEDTDSRFAMTSGFGAIVMLGSRLGISGSGDMDWVWTDVVYSNGRKGTAIKGYVLGLHAGIALVL